MDVSALKSSEPDALPAKGKKAKAIASTVVTISGLAQSFTEIVKAGFSIDRGAVAITDRFAFAKSNAADQPPPRRRDDAPNDTYGRYNDRRDDPRADTPSTDGYRNDGRERVQNGDINAADRDNYGSGPATLSSRDDAAGRNGDQTAANSANSANSSNSGGESDNGQKQVSGKNSGGDNADASAKNTVGQNDGKTAHSNSAEVKNNSEKLLAGQIAVTLNSSVSGRTSEQAGAKTVGAGGPENAVKDLAKALTATSNRNRSNTGGGDQAGLKNHGESGQANAKTAADAQSAVQAAGDPATKVRDITARQAAGIAKAVGDDSKIAVQVAVQNEANVLVSKPRSSLLTTAAKSTGGNKPTHGEGGAQGQTQGGFAQAQNQAATQAQNGLQQAAQAQTASASNVKTPVQGAFNANAGAQGPSGTGGATGGIGGIGGENLPGAGATAQTDHGRQTGEAKSAAGRASLAPRAVIEQVTVQITKALSAGVDKINIQLRPESLGRVEVQLEMAKDGKAIAIVIADNKDTLDLLKQDSQNLEQALRDAGLDLDSGDLNFNLRGEEADGKESNDGTGGHGMAEGGDETGEKAGDSPHAGIYNEIIEEDRIDVRA